MQHKRQEMESEPFPKDREYSKRRKIELLSPTDSGFGDSYYSDSELEQGDKFLDTPPSDPDSLEPFSDGTEHSQRDFKYYHRGSTDSDYLSDGTNAKELVQDRWEHDSKLLPRVFDEAIAIEPLEEHGSHDSENAYREATDPDTSDSTGGSELLEENKQNESEYSDRESTDSEYLPGEFDGTNAAKVLEEHGSEYSYTESTSSETFSDETDGAVELEERKTFISEDERESTEFIYSLEELKQLNETELYKISIYPFRSLNEYLWQPRFNDDSSYENNAYVTEETEEQQLQRAIRNSLIENVPDKGEVKQKGRRSRRVCFEENGIDLKRFRFEENETDSRFRFEENETHLKRVRFEGNETDLKRVRFEENETDLKRVRFEENETNSITRCSEFRSNDDFIFSQFNVTEDARTLHPEKFSKSSEELSRKGHPFIANLLQSMTIKGQVGPKIDDEVRNLVLDIKEKMRGDNSLQIHWLAACLLQFYSDMHRQLDGVLQFSKQTGGELDKLYDKMVEMSSRYRSKEPDCDLFREIMDYLDDLQVEVFLNKNEGLKSHFNALKVLANEMKGLYERQLAYENSNEDAYLNLSRVISFFCPLLVNLCDTAFHTVKKCKEFYRVRNYVLSRLHSN